MFTAAELYVLRRAAAILERGPIAPVGVSEYMDGWRRGRAEMAAENAARNIQTMIWLTRDTDHTAAR